MSLYHHQEKDAPGEFNKFMNYAARCRWLYNRKVCKNTAGRPIAATCAYMINQSTYIYTNTVAVGGWGPPPGPTKCILLSYTLIYTNTMLVKTLGLPKSPLPRV